MTILGISAFYHDSAVAIVKDGHILYAAQEERFTRKKHDPRFPASALARAYEFTGLSPRDIDNVVFYEKPFLKFDRLLSTYVQFAPRGIRSFLSAMPVWFKEKLFIKQLIAEQTGCEKIFFVKHHESHAASAFFPSPFNEAAVITIDGVGEWDTLTIGKGLANRIDIKKTIRFPHSLGLLYSAFTYFNGFRVNSGEYKLMGLAPYGEPRYVNTIYDNLLDVKADGSFRLNLDYFNYHVGLTMTNRKFNRLFGAGPRKAETPIRQLDMDMAASIQAVLEETVEKIAHYTKKEIGGNNLVLAGGVALNCVANGKILRKQIFEKVWIQPAAGDAGGALGAALYLWYHHQDNPRSADEKHDLQAGSFLGPSFSEESIQGFLEENHVRYKKLENDEIPGIVAELLDSEKVVGLYHGRMEFGPRALGHRSIIGDARSENMQKIMNIKIKFRESFRPFAPSLLEEEVGNYFDFHQASPYMLLVYDVKEGKRRLLPQGAAAKTGLEKLSVARSLIPAVTHVDCSARIHTVSETVNPFFYHIIRAFFQKTGCPVIINTSFNVRGEPIVNSPAEAFKVFANTDMDYLLLERFLIEKRDEERKKIDYQWIKQFPLD
jgi:carbamoyltransferase